MGDSTRQKAPEPRQGGNNEVGGIVPVTLPERPAAARKRRPRTLRTLLERRSFFPPSRDMTIGNVLVRNHQVLAKACLGGGFAYGFLYTNSTGSSPIRDAAQATGASDHPPASRLLHVSSFPGAYRLFKPSRAPTRALSGRA